MVAACGQDISNLPEQSITVDGTDLEVAVADSTFERASGLKEVDDLGHLDGMLFAYASPTSARFYMLDTLIPLDIWWFDGDGVLVGTTEMEPCPAEPCTRYASPGPVKWALETEMGVHEFALGSQLSTVETD